MMNNLSYQKQQQIDPTVLALVQQQMAMQQNPAGQMGGAPGGGMPQGPMPGAPMGAQMPQGAPMAPQGGQVPPQMAQALMMALQQQQAQSTPLTAGPSTVTVKTHTRRVPQKQPSNTKIPAAKGGTPMPTSVSPNVPMKNGIPVRRETDVLNEAMRSLTPRTGTNKPDKARRKHVALKVRGAGAANIAVRGSNNAVSGAPSGDPGCIHTNGGGVLCL